MKASASKIIEICSLLDTRPKLLLAKFEINSQVHSVIIDTGASISFIPAKGELFKSIISKPQTANMNVRLADNTIVHIGKKVDLSMRPYPSQSLKCNSTFYVNEEAADILGCQALIGLNSLRKFDLQIQFGKGNFSLVHEGRCIGHSKDTDENYECSVTIDKRLQELRYDNEIQRLLNKYKAVFSDIDGSTIYGKSMRFRLTHGRPIYSKPRHYTPEEIIAMKEHISSLLKKDIIEPSESGYSATSRIIPKKNGTSRLVINYIPLNAFTLRDSYPLPRISDIFNVLQGKQYLTTMDCAQGFYQINVDPRDREKTAFSTPVGSFQFKRCPFGARNSCAVFQARMNNIFADGLYDKCVVYVDDILVFGKDKKEHDSNLEWVLRKAQENNVKIKLEKCCFAQQQVNYLGFCVSGNSIRPLPDKVETLIRAKPPSDKTQLRSLIGKLNFYSRFIPNYSKALEPLRELFRKNRDFQWKPIHQTAYEKLTKQLDKSSVHYIPRREEKKFVELHVSSDSLETICLSQEQTMICRASRLLSPTEMNYSYIEKQLLALILALEKFDVLLEPISTIVKIPSKELKKVFELKHKPERVENLLMRIPARFDNLKFEVNQSLLDETPKKLTSHIPQEIYYVDGACTRNGKPECRATWAFCAEFDRSIEQRGFVSKSPSNNTAEITAAIKACLYAKSKGQNEITIVTDSRYLHSAATCWLDKWKTNNWIDNKKKPVINTELFKELLNAKSDLQIEWIHVKGHATTPGNIRVDMLARGLLDSNIETLNAIVINASNMQSCDEEAEKLKSRIDKEKLQDFLIENEIIYYIDHRLPECDRKRIFVPKISRPWLLSLAHDDPMHGGHLGIKKTMRKLTKYWWPGILSNVESYVRSCEICQSFKTPPGLTNGQLHPIPVSRIFETLHIDIVGPIKTTTRGYKYIITATDAFSKWVYAKPCRDILTKTIINFVEENILAIHGRPDRIISDRGTQFTSSEWDLFLQEHSIKHNLTSPYHPQSNGIDERVNGTIVRILRAYVDGEQSDWDIKLKWAVLTYNTTCHDSTDYSPYEVMHGQKPRSPLNMGGEHHTNDKVDFNLCKDIRRRVNENIKSSQEKQEYYYNLKHKPSYFTTGQMVLIRNHAVPIGLSKKLYRKWNGPVLIKSIISDDKGPKAYEIFDFINMITKVVAVKDIKAYQIRDNEQQLNEGKEEGDTHHCYDDIGYYFNPDSNSTNHGEKTLPEKTNINEPETIEKNDNYSTKLDLTIDCVEGPKASSPRRVTIGNTDIFHYPPEVSNITQTEIAQPPLHQAVQSGGEATTESSIEPEIDFSHKDSHYEPNEDAEISTQERRYNLRSQKLDLPSLWPIKMSRDTIEDQTTILNTYNDEPPTQIDDSDTETFDTAVPDNNETTENIIDMSINEDPHLNN